VNCLRISPLSIDYESFPPVFMVMHQCLNVGIFPRFFVTLLAVLHVPLAAGGMKGQTVTEEAFRIGEIAASVGSSVDARAIAILKPSENPD
jgi:hypothetical protein